MDRQTVCMSVAEKSGQAVILLEIIVVSIILQLL
jgi:hypothetical protein